MTDVASTQPFPPEWSPHRPPTQPPAQPSTEPQPGSAALSGWLQQRLFEQRIVLVQGHLNDETTTHLAAQILTLDATGPAAGVTADSAAAEPDAVPRPERGEQREPGEQEEQEEQGRQDAHSGQDTEPVRLRMDSPSGDLTAVLALMDTLDALVVPVHITVSGELGGASLGLLAAADQRTGQPHARFRLREPRTDMQGSANEMLARTSQHLHMLETLIVRLAGLTGRPRHQVEDDLGSGRFLTAEQAREYGLIDTVAASRPE